MNLKKFYTGKAIGFVFLLVLVAAFYGGMVYSGNNTKTGINNRGTFNQNGIGNMMRGARDGIGQGGFTVGEIIAKDDKSITVKINQNGTDLTQSGSKIILLGTSTTITKSTTGSITDLNVGTSVSITGTPNTDGSITAQSIQIRPNIPQGAKVQ